MVIQYDKDLLEVWDEAKRLRCEWFNDYEKTASKPPMVIADLDVIQLDFRGSTAFNAFSHPESVLIIITIYCFGQYRRQRRLLDGNSTWQRTMGTASQWNCSAWIYIDTCGCHQRLSR